MNCTDNCECSEQEYGRRFLTREEKVAKLTQYQDWLTAEAKGVAEAIERINKR